MTFVPNGLSGTLEVSQPVAPTRSRSRGTARFEWLPRQCDDRSHALAGQNRWTPICGPLTPDLSGASNCQWNIGIGLLSGRPGRTTGQLSDCASCQKRAPSPKRSPSSSPRPHLALTPQRAGPDRVGASQAFKATLTEAERSSAGGRDRPAAGHQGANSARPRSRHRQPGAASFSYVGAKEGQDTAQASYTAPDGAARCRILPRLVVLQRGRDADLLDAGAGQLSLHPPEHAALCVHGEAEDTPSSRRRFRTSTSTRFPRT